MINRTIILSLILCLGAMPGLAQNRDKCLKNISNNNESDLYAYWDRETNVATPEIDITFNATQSFNESVEPTSEPLFAIKTNLLYWAGIMPDFKYYSFLPNLEIEWYYNTDWSVLLTGAYSNWEAGSDKFFGVSSWSLEARRWMFNTAANEGVYIGLYGEIGDYDNQQLHIDDFGNTGDFYGAGISLGYYLPFSKKWGAEFGIRAGWQQLENDVYSNIDSQYYIDYSETKNKWGITGIKASIVYRFGKERSGK